MTLRQHLARRLLHHLDADREAEWMAAHIRGWHHVTPLREQTEDSYRQLARDLLAGLAAHGKARAPGRG
ncbi:cullin [Streptomyces neyagawaensis]|uniref:cullin n=1 Tax=Streptomyces neyagawaensis TaxID=42238 RepID=UPI00201CEF1D|nr:cullin [Streptomyces neyagawaensis]MCL6733310.1 cullin [Streptomyces neyagawaensis]MDE1685112.1 cullin [Streptomyces neyagawaensis]